MRVRLLYTEGKGEFLECAWDKPDIGDNEIEVKALMTGVCRSDIDMMVGKFGPLPLNMQGHEGLGIVTKVGKYLDDIKPGDYVATRGEPAYADYYNVRQFEYVKVPLATPSYILEPVACGINLVYQAKQAIQNKENPRILILGSGFLANVAYQTLQSGGYLNTSVVGKSNSQFWGDVLQSDHTGKFDIVFDISNKDDVFTKPMLNENATVIFGSQKTITTDFSNLLWNACTMIFPSPRNPRFHDCMSFAASQIESGKLKVDSFWTKAYNRDTKWQNAFADGLNRPPSYNRGYIYWN